MDEQAQKQDYAAAQPRQQAGSYAPQGGGYYGGPAAPGSSGAMRIITLVLAIISLALCLIMAAALYDMSGKISHLAEAAQGGQNGLAASVAKLDAQSATLTSQSAALASQADKMAEAGKALRRDVDKISDQTQQNSAAITDMKGRINRMIDLIK